jgi:nicotinamide mononucleotide transporter
LHGPERSVVIRSFPAATAFVNELLRNIWTGLTTATALDQVNLVLGVAGVWLMIRRTLWAFPVGLAAVTVQGILFFRSRIYADAVLQAFFLVKLAWGWRHWVKDRGTAPELPVTRLGARARIVVLAAAAVATCVWALALRRWTDAVIPWRDAFIAAFSVAAQVLQARKNVETWPLWVVVNLVAIPAYWSATLAYSAFLYVLYLVLAFEGWREWRRALRTGTASLAGAG